MLEPMSPHHEVWRGLLFGQRLLILKFTAELKKDFGLTITQFEALLTLLEAPGNTLNTTTLGQHLLYSSGSISHLLARLEELGHIDRSHNAADGRITEVSLTPTGKRLIEDARTAHMGSLDTHFAPLIEPAELQVLLSFTRRLAEDQGVPTQPSTSG